MTTDVTTRQSANADSAAHEGAPKKKSRRPSADAFNVIAVVTAYIVTAGATILTMWAKIRDNFASYVIGREFPVQLDTVIGEGKTLRDVPGISNLPVVNMELSPDKPVIEGVSIKALKNLVSGEGSRRAYLENLTGSFKDTDRAEQKEKIPFSKAFGQVMDNLHVTNSWQKFKKLDKGQQANVLAVSFTVAAISLGAIVSWRHNRQVDQRLREMEDREAERERKQQGLSM